MNADDNIRIASEKLESIFQSRTIRNNMEELNKQLVFLERFILANPNIVDDSIYTEFIKEAGKAFSTIYAIAAKILGADVTEKLKSDINKTMFIWAQSEMNNHEMMPVVLVPNELISSTKMKINSIQILSGD